MYLQIGADTSVRVKDIIGIFSINTTFCCEDSSEFLKISDEDGFVFKLSGEDIKSVILTEIDKNSKIFLSSISSSTLIKRICEEKGKSN